MKDVKQAKKILIIGDAGRGKTTMAATLSEHLGIPYTSTDDMYWKVKFSELREPKEAKKLLKHVLKQDAWIIEGGAMPLYQEALEHADLILHLKHKSTVKQFYFLFRRYLKKREGTLGDLARLYGRVLMKRLRLGYERTNPRAHDLLKPFQDRLVVLASHHAVQDFLRTVSSAR